MDRRRLVTRSGSGSGSGSKSPSRLPFLFLISLVLALFTTSHSANAFCGFFVNTGAEPLFNEATRVVMMRAGLRTVLSIQNDYKGPLEDFALVVPVPIVLEKKNVRTLPAKAFDRIDRLTAPRLVEYWEQDPCEAAKTARRSQQEGGGGALRAKAEDGALGGPKQVKVEAEFSVDEFDIVVLSALDSNALETWLRENKYAIPAGAEPYLRPYVNEGMKFFVAKVDASRVKFRWGRAQLSPLRFFYDTPSFSLPTRLGLINSNGTQDLIVQVLGGERYEVANYENLTIPTNLSVKNETRTQFNAFYAGLFDQTLKGHPKAVVTEYAWSPAKCDPCPSGSGPLSEEDVALFGRDVIAKEDIPQQLVLTRLHARYGKEAAEDLVFKTAPAIEGGVGGSGLDLPHTAIASAKITGNQFQGRYIIRHPWNGPIGCDDPIYGTWGSDTHYSPDSKTNLPKLSPQARRDLDPAQLVITNPAAAFPSHAGKGISFGDRVRLILDEPGERVMANLLAVPLSLVLLIVAAFVKKRPVLRTTGLFVLLCALQWVCAVSMRDGFRLDPSGGGRSLGEDLGFVISLLAAALIAFTRFQPGVVIERRLGPLAIFACLPLLASFLAALHSANRTFDILKSEPLDLDSMIRGTAEIGHDVFARIQAGCLRTGVLLVLVAWIAARPTARRGAAAAAVTMLVVGVARAFIVPEPLGIIDVMTVMLIGIAAASIDRALATQPRRDARPYFMTLAAMTGVVLLDLGTRYFRLSQILNNLSSYSLDPGQREKLLDAMLATQKMRGWLLVFDLAVLALIAVAVARANRIADEPSSSNDVKLAPRERGWMLASTVISIGSILITLVALEWSGVRRGLTSLTTITGHFTAKKTPSSFTPVSAEVAGQFPIEIQGPALVVDSSAALFGSSRPGEAPEPLSPALLEKMGRTAAESTGGGVPFLVAPKELTMAQLWNAVGPFTKQRQYDFRLLPTPEAPIERLGVFHPLATAIELRPHEVHLVDVATASAAIVDAEREKALIPCVALIPDARVEHFKVVGLVRDAETYFRAKSFSLEGTVSVNDHPSVQLDIEKARARDTALIAFPLDTPVAKIDLVLRRLASMRVILGWRMEEPLFHRVVIMKNTDALRSLGSAP